MAGHAQKREKVLRGWRPLGSLTLLLVAWLIPASAAGRTATAGGKHRLLAWGMNFDGQLGDGTATGPQSCEHGYIPCATRPVRVKLRQGTRVVELAAGEDHSLALTSTGQVLAWGNNEVGQLGDGTRTSHDHPVKVKLPKGTKVVQVAAGGGFSLALTSTGQVLGWGFNHGELGDGTRTSHDHPVKVKLPKGTKAVAVAAGGNHGMALTRRGVVFTWGYNRFGELGDGTKTNSLSPVKVSLPPGATAVAVAAGNDYNLALTRAGQVLAWGFNADGELGDGTFTGPTTCTRFHYGCATTPVQVQLPAGTKVVALAAGGDHALALTSAHQVLAWGNNESGALGDGSSTGPDKCIWQERCATTPVDVQLPKGTKVVEVAAGFRHSLALTSTGLVLAWGYSADGELGNGNRTKCDHPVKVDLPKGDKATSVRSGPVADHSLALVHSP